LQGEPVDGERLGEERAAEERGEYECCFEFHWCGGELRVWVWSRCDRRRDWGRFRGGTRRFRIP
jgi:hypothetical protein